jgi:hypothetical protein
VTRSEIQLGHGLHCSLVYTVRPAADTEEEMAKLILICHFEQALQLDCKFSESIGQLCNHKWEADLFLPSALQVPRCPWAIELLSLVTEGG